MTESGTLMHVACLLILYVTSSSAISPPLNDPLWRYQWYLNPNARGYDLTLNVLEPWRNDITGRGVKVAVVDQGVKDSGDLAGQVIDKIDNREWCGLNCQSTSGDHGSKAAGVIAMIADNNKCGVGIAPEASIVDIPIFGRRIPTAEVKGNALESGLDDPGVDIYSNSWGTFDGGASMAEMSPEVREAIKKGVEEGRDGKGALYVWASGNGGTNADSCAYDAFVNSPMTVSVSGVNFQGSLLATGEKCSAIMAAAPSRGSDDGYYESPVITPIDGTDCSYKFSESSAAAAMGSGVLALLLQANPNLGWRDVQHLIPLTSNPCIADDSVTNGRGLKYSHSVGFGFLNAEALVSAGQNWENVASEPIVCHATFYPQRQAGVRRGTIRLPADGITCPEGATIGYLEHVIVDITAAPLVRGSMKINVTSPAGTKSITFPGRWQDLIGSPHANLTNWRVLSYAFWGESLSGDGSRDWDLRFSGVDSSRITRLDIEFRGLARAPSRMPRDIQPCKRPSSALLNDMDLPSNCQPWSDWSSCSVSCGDGRRTRRRYCMMDDWVEERQREACNAGACAHNERCPTTCNRERNVVPAGECSAVCGPGSKKENLECEVWQEGWVSSGYVWTSCYRELTCTGSRCRETATDQCPGGVNPLSDWGRCSVSCGGGNRQRTARCFGIRGTYTDVYQWQDCNEQRCFDGSTAPVDRLNCVTPLIEGPWATCSVSCGDSGIQRREVQCNNNRGQTVSTIESRRCTGMPPCPDAGSAICEQPTGDYYPWSTCSTSCGPGQRSRVYRCETDRSDTRLFLETESCEVEACPTTTTGTTTPDNCIVITDYGCQPAVGGCSRTYIKSCGGQTFVAIDRCECS